MLGVWESLRRFLGHPATLSSVVGGGCLNLTGLVVRFGGLGRFCRGSGLMAQRDLLDHVGVSENSGYLILVSF